MHQFCRINVMQLTVTAHLNKSIDHLQTPLMDLSRAERQARDDQHLADVIGLYDRANSETSVEHEVGTVILY